MNGAEASESNVTLNVENKFAGCDVKGPLFTGASVILFD